MLRQTVTGEEETGAARARATPEEVAAALRELQSRGSGGTGPATVELGEVVRELELDVTPEELLAVIRERRRQAARRPRTGGRRRQVLTLLACGFLGTTFLWGVRRSAMPPAAVLTATQAPVLPSPAPGPFASPGVDRSFRDVDGDGWPDVHFSAPAPGAPPPVPPAR